MNLKFDIERNEMQTEIAFRSKQTSDAKDAYRRAVIGQKSAPDLELELEKKYEELDGREENSPKPFLYMIGREPTGMSI